MKTAGGALRQEHPPAAAHVTQALPSGGPAPLPVSQPIPLDLDAAARAFADALDRATRPVLASLGRAPEPSELYELLVSAAWGSARVLSLDIFDTALVRKARAPRDVFLWLHDLAPFDALALGQDAVVRVRMEAEMAARQRAHKQRGTAEVPLSEIYAEFARITGASASLVPAMVETEENVERALAVAHPVIQALYQRAHAEGKRVAFVSDTFHTAAFLRDLLVRIGYDHPGDLVFSSADEGRSKGDRRLFPLVLERLGVPAQSVLHVGDHPVSDQATPAALGICAVWHPFAGTHDPEHASKKRDDSLLNGIAAIGARCLSPAPSFFWRFGFSAAGPLLVGFAEWLHARLTTDRIDRAYFLLRDGEILKRVYDIVTAERSGAIAARLLESSRRAYMLPAVSSGVSALTSQLFVSENPRPVGQFLSRYGIRIDDLSIAFHAAGFRDAHEVINLQERRDVDRLARLYSQPQVAHRLRDASNSERANLMAYLRQEQLFDGGRVALVDIGWNGSIQKALVHACRLERQPLDVSGYYLGTFPQAEVDADGMRLAGYICELGLPAGRAQPLYEFPQLVELVCTSARGSLLRFERDGERMKAVNGPIDHSPTQLGIVKQIHDGVAAFAEWYRDEASVFGVSDVSPDSALRNLAEIVLNPTAREAEEIGALTHGDGMGASLSRAFARFSDGPMDVDTLRRDHKRAYWKKGLVSQRNAHALALRSLIFQGRER